LTPTTDRGTKYKLNRVLQLTNSFYTGRLFIYIFIFELLKPIFFRIKALDTQQKDSLTYTLRKLCLIRIKISLIVNGL